MTELPTAVKIGPPGPKTITFSLIDGQWFMKMSEKNGIEFNREAFPNATPDDFSNEFIKILEKYFTVKFERRNE